MKRLNLLLLIAFMMIGGFGLMIFWLFGTTEGARWVLKAISHSTSIKIEAQKISGQIGHQLKMEGIQVHWPEGEMKASRFHLQWQPLFLLLGKVRIERLILNDIKIQDDRPPIKKAFDLQWPRLPGLIYWIHGRVSFLHIDQLSYRHGERSPFLVEKLYAKLDWHHGLLTFEEISIDIPSGGVQGIFECGFQRPSLYLDLHLSPKESYLGLDKLHLRSRLLPPRSSDHVAGHLFVEGMSRSIRKLLIESDIGITQKAITFSKFFISRPHRQGTLSGEGQITFPNHEMMMNLRMQFSDLDLSRELTLKTTLSGTLHIEGNPEDYRGEMRIENKKGEWNSGSLLGRFRGTLKGIHFTLLDGSILNGQVEGQLDAQWEEGFSLRGALQARNLNPALMSSDWSGMINLDLKGTYHKPKQKPSEGRFQAHLHQSHLRGQPLTGNMEMALEKSLLRLEKADLRGKGFHLFARGVLQERLLFHANISDLSGLIPGTRGSLFTKGWGRWKDRQLAIELDNQGKDLFVKGLALGKGSLSARIGEHGDAPIEVRGDFKKMAYQSLKMDSATLEVKGKLANHQIFFTMSWPKGKIEASAEGGYFKEVWQGKIIQLMGGPMNRTWRMESPTSISFSSRQLFLKSLSITSEQEERLHLSADLALNPLRGNIEAEWHQFDLAWANALIGKQSWDGSTTGYLSLQWVEEGRLRMTGMIRLIGATMETPFRIRLSHGFMKFNWNEKGLLASWEVKDTASGRLWGSLSSSQAGQMVVPDRGKIEAYWEAIDLSPFQTLFPKMMTIEGQLDGQLSVQWTDRMRKFRAKGQLSVSEGMMAWEYGKDKIQKPLRVAEVRCDWHDDQLSGHLLFGLEDTVDLKGHFRLPIFSGWPASIQTESPIQLSLQGQFQDKGLMAIFFPDFLKESRGKVDLQWRADGTWKKPDFQGHLRVKKTEVQLKGDKTPLTKAKGNFSEGGLKLGLDQGLIQFHWGERDLQLTWNFDFEKNGTFQGNLTSTQTAEMAFPKQGAFVARWEKIDLSFIKVFLPPQMVFEGGLTGHLSGHWINRKFDISGETKISQGVMRWENEGGSIKASLRDAYMKWDWRDDRLLGDFSLVLMDYGYVTGNFHFPLSARWPTTLRPKDSMGFSLQGLVQERGLLQVLFPGMVQESQGQMQINLMGKGTWQRPNLEGDLKLEKAGGYLPSLGIRLEGLNGEAQFKGEEIRIRSFQARSGPGQIEGEAVIRIENWKLTHYEGHLKGERFQSIHLPELRVLSSPHLDFHGNTEKILIRGEIHFPDFLISGSPTKDVIRPSSDVVVVDMPEAIPKGLPILPDVEVRLLLGEKVYYKTEGVDVRLRGDLRLRLQDPHKIGVTGEIGVAEGHYRFYGHRLEIIRGRLLFDGSSVNNPNVDALAVRKIGEVQAGVAVTGSLQKPIVKLYSRPSLSDTDILSYIVLGQPLGKGTEAIPSLMQAAGALLSAGESVMLQGKLRKMFGLDILDITTPPGRDEVSRSMVTIGKYLTPKLYISLGRSLFTDTTLVTLRYALSKRLEVEASTGTESGGTLFYRIEFK